MKDPRQPMDPASYTRLLGLATALMVAWVLVSIWFDLPELLTKVFLTAVILGGMLLFTWPVRGKKRA